jgi:stage II sporulation protein D
LFSSRTDSAIRRLLLIAVLLWCAGASAPARAEKLGALVGPVRLVPTSNDPITVAGLHSYFGTITLAPASDGLVIVDRLPLEHYLLGLEEVPRDWPMEALRAQAVAARTYALRTLNMPRAGAAATYGFDICASVECQVFAGADVVAGEDGDRWVEAVTSTQEQAILYDGEPILARYHSTSGGRTLGNRQAFTDEAAYPYLRPVESTTEGASPLYRWRVRFPLRRLAPMLASAGWWTGHGRLIEVFTIPSRAGLHYPDVVFRGARGREVRSAEEVRDLLRELAPAWYPNAYPSRWHTTSGFLPETLPSNRFEVATRKRVAVVSGRGWGHGVGMSQWGAHGLASQGSDFEEILTHYYSGTTVGAAPDPGPIEVGVDWAESAATASGAFRIVDGRGRTLVREALGTWTFRFAGGGAVAVNPPRGYGLPLRVGVVSAPEEVEPGDEVPITLALSKPARVRTLGARAEVLEAGRREVVWTAPEEPGTYEVVVEASANGRTRRAEAVSVAVRSQSEADAAGAPEEAAPSEAVRWPLVIIGAALVLVGVGMAVRLTRRAR